MAGELTSIFLGDDFITRHGVEVDIDHANVTTWGGLNARIRVEYAAAAGGPWTVLPASAIGSTTDACGTPPINNDANGIDASQQSVTSTRFVLNFDGLIPAGSDVHLRFTPNDNGTDTDTPQQQPPITLRQRPTTPACLPGNISTDRYTPGFGSSAPFRFNSNVGACPPDRIVWEVSSAGPTGPWTTLPEQDAEDAAPSGPEQTGLTPGTTYWFRALTLSEQVETGSPGSPTVYAGPTAACEVTTAEFDLNNENCQPATNITTQGATLSATADNVPTNRDLTIQASENGGVTWTEVARVAGSNTVGQTVSGTYTVVAPGATVTYRAEVRGQGPNASNATSVESTSCSFQALFINCDGDQGSTAGTRFIGGSHGSIPNGGSGWTYQFEYTPQSGGATLVEPATPQPLTFAPAGSEQASITGTDPTETYDFIYVLYEPDGSGGFIRHESTNQCTFQGVPPGATCSSGPGATAVTATSATLNGDWTSMSPPSDYAMFFQYAVADGPPQSSWPNSTPPVTATASDETQAVPITGLTPNTTYRYRAVVRHLPSGTDYPEPSRNQDGCSFTTTNVPAPQFGEECGPTGQVTQTGAQLAATVDNVPATHTVRAAIGTAPGGPYTIFHPLGSGDGTVDQHLASQWTGGSGGQDYYYVIQTLDASSTVVSQSAVECGFRTPANGGELINMACDTGTVNPTDAVIGASSMSNVPAGTEAVFVWDVAGAGTPPYANQAGPVAVAAGATDVSTTLTGLTEQTNYEYRVILRRVSDGVVLQSTLPCSFSTPASNLPPVIADTDDQTGPIGQPASDDFTVTDPDGTVVSVTSAPAGAVITDNGGGSYTITYTPTSTTPVTFTITATDDDGATSTDTITFNGSAGDATCGPTTDVDNNSGNIAGDYTGAPEGYTARLVWGTAAGGPFPNVAAEHTVDASGSGSLDGDVLDLLPNTTVYYRVEIVEPGGTAPASTSATCQFTTRNVRDSGTVPQPCDDGTGGDPADPSTSNDDECLVDDNGVFFRRTTNDGEGNITVTNVDVAGNPYTPVGTVEPCGGAGDERTRADVEHDTVCADGETVTRIRTYSGIDGTLASQTFIRADGTAVTPTGTITLGPCAAPTATPETVAPHAERLLATAGPDAWAGATGTLLAVSVTGINGTTRVVDSDGTTTDLAPGETLSWSVNEDENTLTAPQSITAQPAAGPGAPVGEALVAWTER